MVCLLLVLLLFVGDTIEAGGGDGYISKPAHPWKCFVRAVRGDGWMDGWMDESGGVCLCL